MTIETVVPESRYFQPLSPDAVDQGDPFVLKLSPDSSFPYTYYCYVTGSGNPEIGWSFPVYGSRDLVHWDYLGPSLQSDPSREHWAPCVLYLPTLSEPFVMLYSKAIGRGERAHQGHQIYRATSKLPEGPFHTSGIVTPEVEFAIDPDVFRDRRGSLVLTFATDFETGERIGTGLADVEISDDLSRTISPIREIARATADWQIFDASRSMPWKRIPAVDWERGDTVRWHTVEAPATVYSPRGRRVVFYSGGFFGGDYAVGALVENESGILVDRSQEPHSRLIYADPAKGFYAPGHGSVVVGPQEQLFYLFHARFGSVERNRQMVLAPIQWRPDGMPFIATGPFSKEERDEREQWTESP